MWVSEVKTAPVSSRLRGHYEVRAPAGPNAVTVRNSCDTCVAAAPLSRCELTNIQFLRCRRPGDRGAARAKVGTSPLPAVSSGHSTAGDTRQHSRHTASSTAGWRRGWAGWGRGWASCGGGAAWRRGRVWGSCPRTGGTPWSPAASPSGGPRHQHPPSHPQRPPTLPPPPPPPPTLWQTSWGIWPVQSVREALPRRLPIPRPPSLVTWSPWTEWGGQDWRQAGCWMTPLELQFMKTTTGKLNLTKKPSGLQLLNPWHNQQMGMSTGMSTKMESSWSHSLTNFKTRGMRKTLMMVMKL